MGLREPTVRVRLSYAAGNRLWDLHQPGWGISMVPYGNDEWIVGFRDEECLRAFMERAMGVLCGFPKKEFRRMVDRAER